jgi:hypothetical protein
MGYTPQEFQTAFDKASAKHSLVFTKAQDVASHFSTRLEVNRRKARYEQVKFGELIRLTLNDKGIWSEPARAAYGSLIGHLYSPRANAAKKHQPKKPVPKAQPPTPPPNIIRRMNGQLAWEI